MKNLPLFTSLLCKTDQRVTGNITKNGIRRIVYQDADAKQIFIETTENIYDLLHAIEYREKEYGKHIGQYRSKRKGCIPNLPTTGWKNG